MAEEHSLLEYKDYDLKFRVGMCIKPEFFLVYFELIKFISKKEAVKVEFL